MRDNLHCVLLVKGIGDVIYAGELGRHSSFKANELLFSAGTMEGCRTPPLIFENKKKKERKKKTKLELKVRVIQTPD